MDNAFSIITCLLAVVPALASLVTVGGNELERAERYLRVRDALFPDGLKSDASAAERAEYDELQISIRYWVLQDSIRSHHYPISDTLYFTQLISLSIYAAYIASLIDLSSEDWATLPNCVNLFGVIAVLAFCLYIVMTRRTSLKFEALRKSPNASLADFVSDKKVDDQSADWMIPLVAMFVGAWFFRYVVPCQAWWIVLLVAGASAVVTFVHAVRRDSGSSSGKDSSSS